MKINSEQMTSDVLPQAFCQCTVSCSCGQKKYNLVYADPPWSYTQKQVGRGNKSGAFDKYSLMSNTDIAAMPVKEITAENAICFMWGTIPLLPEAIAALHGWGFKYKTKITWEKTGCLGMGNWFRIQEEYMLIGIKGTVKPFGCQHKSIYKHPICHHSAKPHFFRELVMELSAKSLGECERLEMFARSREGMFSDYEYEGWDVYGNQVNNSIKLNAGNNYV